MTKYQEIAHLLRSRVERGEYPNHKLPPLRKLAADMGVSYMTARQAVKTFQEAGWHEIRTARPFVAMVTPLWNFTEWHRAILDNTRKLGGQVRFVAYCSETDPNISETINQEEYDLIFLSLPDRDDSRLLELISKSRHRVVVMFRDMTRYGVRCLDGVNPAGVECFMELLKQRGVRRIDALGRDTDSTTGQVDKYHVWRRWIERNHFDGRYFAVEHKPFDQDDVNAAAYCRQILERGELGEAVFCLTSYMANGLYRACYEKGIVPGRDISVFSLGEQNHAKLMTPALATIECRDISSLVESVIEEYCPGAERSDRLMFRLETADMFLGESLMAGKECLS